MTIKKYFQLRVVVVVELVVQVENHSVCLTVPVVQTSICVRGVHVRVHY